MDSKDKNSQKAKAQVGSWVIPNSKDGDAKTRADDEGAARQPAPSEKKKRLSPLSLRVSKDQRREIKRRAKEADLSVNRYLLMQALGLDLAPARLTPEDRTERACVLRAYRGTGNLLNQIARHLNSGRVIGAVDIASVIKRHEENAAKLLAAFLKGGP